jgi:predicted dehydrogenase
LVTIKKPTVSEMNNVMSKEQPVKICLVGCGRIAHAHIAGIREIPDYVEIAAVVEKEPQQAQDFCRQYGIKTSYSDLQTALLHSEFEAVDICLPNYLHRDVAVNSLKAGKHVLVEKPMAITVAESQDMVEAAQKSNKILMVGQSRRFYDAVMASKKMLDEGQIGIPVSITANLFGYLKKAPTAWWKEKDKTGGLMISIWGSHIIDYIIWMFGKCPERVYCEAYSCNPEWEGEDEVTLLLGYEDGRFATIKMSWNTRLNDEEWDGKGKMLSSSDIIYERFIHGSKSTLQLRDETELSRNGKILISGSQKYSNFAREFMEFADAIRKKHVPLASGREIMDVIRVQEAALKSASTHQVVWL